ncbi:MAG: MerR family transcriptional regulator [Planctomycetota bacterium]
MGSSPDTFDITELARLAGVSARTIRYYGELDLLKATSRGPGGRRQYGADAAERLRFISRLKALGLTLEEVGELNRSFDVGATPAMLEHLDELLAARQADVAERIRELRGLETDLQDYRDRIRNKPRNEQTPS